MPNGLSSAHDCDLANIDHPKSALAEKPSRAGSWTALKVASSRARIQFTCERDDQLLLLLANTSIQRSDTAEAVFSCVLSRDETNDDGSGDEMRFGMACQSNHIQQ